MSYEAKKFILSIDTKLKTDGDPQPLKKTAQVIDTRKSTVWRVVKSGPQ
jgi:hypothetical protein